MALHPTSSGEKRPPGGSGAGGSASPWVERWQSGVDPEESFRQIFHRYSRLVYSFFTKRGFPAEECDDLVQETFLRVHKSLATFRGDSRFETWLWQIAANVYRNTLRNQATRKRDGEVVPLSAALGGTDEGVPAFVDGRSREPLGTVLADERSRLLREAMDGLPAQMRRCVLLRVDHDLRYREIAQLMKVSIDTVKAHLFQARQLLKGKLGEYYADPNF